MKLLVVVLALALLPGAVAADGFDYCVYHDPTFWHDLYNAGDACFYDHEHGENPALVDDIFGESGAWLGYPNWQIGTPAATQDELTYGHPVWKVYVRRDMPPGYMSPVADGAYIKALRVQVHAHAGGEGIKHRRHGFIYEVQACRPTADGETCGIMRATGRFDYGNLRLIYPDGHTALAMLPGEGDGQDVVIPAPPAGKRQHPTVDGSPLAIWYSNTVAFPLGSVGIQVLIEDSWTYAIPTSTGADLVYILNGNNGSKRNLHVVVARSQKWQPKNGLVITDVYGKPSAACTTLGQAECGAMQIQNWPTTSLMLWADRSTFVEYDNTGTIRLPN